MYTSLGAVIHKKLTTVAAMYAAFILRYELVESDRVSCLVVVVAAK